MEQNTDHKIFQIFYDENTRKKNDEGFLQLDNFANERPDWAEYWPIRNYLLNNELNNNSYYGFFSPKFNEKTGLNSRQVYDFLENSTEDLIIFSPFYDFTALLLNIFENHQKDIVFEEIFLKFNKKINTNNLVMSSLDTIFCNFFAAKKNIWTIWLENCEQIFSICESNEDQLSKYLNSHIQHPGKNMQCKVFVIERIISFLLILNSKKWSVKIYDPLKLPLINNINSNSINELLVLDSLKIAYNKTNRIDYINLFNLKRAEYLMRLQSNS
jgi:hypothetical protein